MRIIITGAAGRIGSQVVEELSRSHELCLIDIRPLQGRKSIVADLSRHPVINGWSGWFRRHSSRWSDAFQGAEVVIHLAANPSQSAPWEKVLPHNIEALWNVIEAAAHHQVSRVVFASSNWAVKALEQKLAPACYLPDGPKIGSDAPACPINPYGASKAFGEVTGRMFVDQQKLRSYVAVRIGSYRPVFQYKGEHAHWIGTDDIRSLFRRCVEADFEGFHIVYGVSAQPTVPYDLSHTRRLLSWEPVQTIEA